MFNIGQASKAPVQNVEWSKAAARIALARPWQVFPGLEWYSRVMGAKRETSTPTNSMGSSEG